MKRCLPSHTRGRRTLAFVTAVSGGICVCVSLAAAQEPASAVQKASFSKTLPSKATPSRTMTLFLGGDVLPGRGVTRRWEAGRTPLHFFAPLIARSDLAFCNLEGAPLMLAGARRRTPTFALPQLEGLQRTGIDIVSLANNHALDSGEKGLDATMRQLENLGLDAVGGTFEKGDESGRNWREVVRGGVTFLAVTQYGPFRDGSAQLARLDDGLIQRVSAASAKGLVVVSLHWGTEGRTAPAPWQRSFARRLIDAGAQVVVGHHPHVAGPVEVYRGRPIFYSLGNFVWDTMPARAMPVEQSGLVAQVRLENGRTTWQTWNVVPTDEGPPLPSGEMRLGSASGLFTSENVPERVVWSRDGRGQNRLRNWQWLGNRWRIVAQTVAGNLAKLVAADVNGDGRDELLVEAHQGAKLESQILPRLQVYAVDARRGFVPKWRGSHLSRPFLAWTTFPAEKTFPVSGKDESAGNNSAELEVGILARELNTAPQWRGREWLALYRWNGFGFRVSWEISVRGHIRALQSGRDARSPWATFVQDDGGRLKKWRLRPVSNEDGTEKLRAEPA